MPQYFAALKTVAKKAVTSQAVEQTIAIAAGYILAELRLTDLRAKKMLLKRKRAYHIYLLGKTFYRLSQEGVDPTHDPKISMIANVIDEIGEEIEAVEEELARRKAFESNRRHAERQRRKESNKTA